jgi:alginate O-acetyltransferase complex protein AlgJ
MLFKRIQNKIIFFIIPFILLIPFALTWIYPDTNSAKIELKEIQDVPKFPKSLYEMVSWPELVNNYINDHFFLRSFFIKYISKFLYCVNISINKDVLIGKNGWLFLSRDHDIIDKYRGSKNLSPEDAEEWIKTLSADARFLKKNGIDFWFIIVPNKCTVYPQYLPDWCTHVAPSLTETLIQRLRNQEDIHWLDLRPVLIQAVKKKPVYEKHETHWNDYGAFVAYQYIMEQLPKTLNLSSLSEKNIKFSKIKVSGDLARLLNLADLLTEERVVAEISNSSVLYQEKAGNFQIQGFWAVVTSKHSARAVILCDSFVEGVMRKYLQESFSYSFFKQHNCKSIDRNLILEKHPDIVLYAIVERLIPYRLIEQ